MCVAAYIDLVSHAWYASQMRSAIWILGASLLVVGGAASLGCGSSETPVTCDEGGCECRDRNTCELDCGDIVPCAPSCLNFGDSCTVFCADDCELGCRGGDREDGLCAAECGMNCSASCGSVGRCIVRAEEDSNFLCVNAGSCGASLGDGSTAQCLQVAGTCDIRCTGTCQVLCDFVGACNVQCEEGERRLCGDDYYVCGMECPEEMMAPMMPML